MNTFVLGHQHGQIVLPWLVGTKHFPESKSISQNPKTRPRNQNSSSSGTCFWILGSVLGFWEVFLDSGKCFGFWEVFLDSGQCFGFWEVFWILGSVFGFWEVACIIFLFPSSRASRSCRAPREISRSPRLAHKAPVMQAIWEVFWILGSVLSLQAMTSSENKQ